VASSAVHDSTVLPKDRIRDFRKTITDPRILAEVRRLIASNRFGEGLAGFRAENNGRRNICLEAQCTCGFETCGPWRIPATRCTAFEQMLLPAFPSLSVAYWAHLRGAPVPFKVERCRHLKCRKRCAPDSSYCSFHAEWHERDARRATREHRKARAMERGKVA
jgi:hypothetical protein